MAFEALAEWVADQWREDHGEEIEGTGGDES